MSVASAVDLREPKPENRSRIEAMVRATGLFREEEVEIALEVFDGSLGARGCARPEAGRPDGAGVSDTSVARRGTASALPDSPVPSAVDCVAGDLPVPSAVDRVAGDLPDYTSIVACDHDTVIGWVAFGQRPCTDGTYDCYWIVVDPARHGAGIGTQLIEAMERRLSDRARLIVAETSGRSEYAPTRTFYERVGYRAQSRIPDFYSDGDDLVVFVKYLSHAVRP